MLNEVARILEQNSEQYEPAEVLEQVNAAIVSTGRIGAAPEPFGGASPGRAVTRLEQGVLLSEFLTEREQHLDTGPDDPERPTPGTGFSRNL